MAFNHRSCRWRSPRPHSLRKLATCRRPCSALSAVGVRIALDDFGTGYSTLVYLQRLSADVLKIDRSFVEHISRSTRDREIVAAVTAMSHALGMTVVGEGIETSHQLAILAGLDRHEGQGLLFGQPLTPEAVVTLMETGRSPYEPVAPENLPLAPSEQAMMSGRWSLLT